MEARFVIVCVLAAACRPPYSPRTTPLDDDKTQSADDFEDQYAESGPPKLVVAPAFDIQIFGPDSMTVAAEVHANVPSILAFTGYAGYGVFGNSSYRLEGYAGFPLFKGTAYTVGNWALRQSRSGDTLTTTYKRVNLPVYSLLAIEGGFRLQGISFAGAGTTSESAVGWVRIGLRRKTFWNAKAASGETARSMASWWLHAVLPPVGVPDPAMAGTPVTYKGLFGDGEVASRPVGGAFGVEFPAWVRSPVLFRAEFAYLPGPHGAELMIGANYLFHAL